MSGSANRAEAQYLLCLGGDGDTIGNTRIQTVGVSEPEIGRVDFEVAQRAIASERCVEFLKQPGFRRRLVVSFS